MEKKYILDEATAAIKLRRIALEIVENNLGEESVILVGIEENGSIIAQTVEQILQENGSLQVERISLSLNKKHPGDIHLNPSVNFDNRVILIVDDVANSGKTMLYALKPFLQFHPKKIQTLALVERTHKAFPVNLDYKGLSVATTLQEHIYVEVSGRTVTGAYLQ